MHHSLDVHILYKYDWTSSNMLTSQDDSEWEINESKDEDEHENDSEELTISSWPNPSSDEFSLKLKTDNKTDDIEITVLDKNRKTVNYTNFVLDEINSKVYQFGNNLEGGVYIARIVQKNDVKYLKLVKV